MRIVFLVESLQLAGAERVVLELARGRMSSGCEAHVITLREDHSINDVQLREVKTMALFRRGEFSWPKSAPRAAIRLRKSIVELKADVVAIHTPKLALLLALAGIRIPAVWVLHGHDSCWDPVTVRQRLSRVLQRWTARRLGGHLVAVSRSLANHAAAGLNVEPEEIAVIPNGVDTDRFHFEMKTLPREPVVCVLGRLVPWKGPRAAVDAFRILKRDWPGARLWFVGDGPMRAELAAEAAVAEWNGSITLWGMLQYPEERLREASVLWHLSESEGFGIACVEAMASGVPIVGFDVRGVRDLLHEGCGILVPFKNVLKLATQTTQLFRDPMRYRAIAEKAFGQVNTRYTLQTMCANHYELMRSVYMKSNAKLPSHITEPITIQTESQAQEARNGQ